MDATVSPITDPPKKATESAWAGPSFLAARVVRTFALVAVYIPMNPAIEEERAPRKKASDCCLPYSCFWKKKSAPPMIRAKMDMRRNSLLMKTMAPR